MRSNIAILMNQSIFKCNNCICNACTDNKGNRPINGSCDLCQKCKKGIITKDINTCPNIERRLAQDEVVKLNKKIS